MKHDYKTICSELLIDLPERHGDVLARRFGLREKREPETLQSIGNAYAITRERVRQIEEDALKKVRKTAAAKYQDVFQNFSRYLKNQGNFKKEAVLLVEFGGQDLQNEVLFLLSLGDFQRFHETKNFHSLWTTKIDSFNIAKDLIGAFIAELSNRKQPIFLKDYNLPPDLKIEKGCLSSYLEISKIILKSPDGLYGLKDWPEINPRSTKDRAYLALRKKKKPLHFTEITSLIEKLDVRFADITRPPVRKINLQTVHNELIKDRRFVLVGRGIYALKEWGYEPGVVKEVILKTLKEGGSPLEKEEIMKKVLSQRFVKRSTIFQNLQDKNYFIKDSSGKYFVREA